MNDEPEGTTQPISVPNQNEGTQPVAVHPAEVTQAGTPGTPPGKYREPDTKPRKSKLGWIILGGILLVMAAGVLGSFLGYKAAERAKAQAYASEVTRTATEHFMLALDAEKSEQYEVAVRHLDYVLKLDPNFPGVKEKLTELMILMAVENTPTPVPTQPTITPTPTQDLRGEEEIFANAKALMAANEWFQAVDVLNTLRDKNLTFRAIEVDGLYYVGLRNRGMAKISGGLLEEGLYDLALVERFGPIDVDANNLRTWARLYISGSRYWGVKWDKVVSAFAEIYPAFPGMVDASGMSAAERFRVASLKYGDQLYGEGKWCEALVQYTNASGIQTDGALDATATQSMFMCEPPTGTPTATLALTPTPSLTLDLATLEPSVTPAVDTPSPEPATPPPTDPPATAEPPTSVPYPAP